MKNQRLTSVIGLSFDAGRLEGAVVKRTNGSVTILKLFSAALSLDPLTNEPELVGQEIRNILEKADVREKRCAVCLPLNWALTLQTKVPELGEGDLESLLVLEAERGFPYGLDALLISSSMVRLPGHDLFATQVAVPREHVLRLEKALRAAKLKPVTMSLGIAAMQPATTEQGTLSLFPAENSVALQIACGGGVAALRSLEGAVETEGGLQHIQADAVAREIRVTLGQIPAEMREALQTVKVFGQGEIGQQLTEQLRSRLESSGLKVRQIVQCTAEDLGVKPPSDAVVSPAFCLAARVLAGKQAELEFLPPKVSTWQQFTTRYSSGKLVWAGSAAAAVAFLVGGFLFYQYWQLSQLQTKWAKMSPQVAELDNLQQQIRRFRPWFDNSMSNLSILRRLAEAFPEDGVVSAKIVEIREMSNVSCSGTARDNLMLLKTLDQLRATKEIGDVKVDQIRGKSPLQFTFNFHWGEKGAQ